MAAVTSLGLGKTMEKCFYSCLEVYTIFETDSNKSRI